MPGLLLLLFVSNINCMKKELEQALETLKIGGLILYPTDTVWGIGCDATNEEAVKRVYRLKQRDDSKALVCLVNGPHMLETYVEIVSEKIYDVLESAIKPTTVIYQNPIGVATNVISEDKTLAIRMVKHDFCEHLIKQLGKPIVSTSANISGETTPTCFDEISSDILKGVDYVVNLQKEKKASEPSTIIKLNNDGTVGIIRN